MNDKGEIPKPASPLRGRGEALRLAAKAIYIERSGRSDTKRRISNDECNEHFDWYDAGKSNPESSVHYSNVAYAIKDAAAALSSSAPPEQPAAEDHA